MFTIYASACHEQHFNFQYEQSQKQTSKKIINLLINSMFIVPQKRKNIEYQLYTVFYGPYDALDYKAHCQ